jgi:hypothetical protein
MLPDVKYYHRLFVFWFVELSVSEYTMGTICPRSGCGVDHPRPSSADVKGRVQLYACFLSGPSWPVLGWTLPFNLIIVECRACLNVSNHRIFLIRLWILHCLCGTMHAFCRLLSTLSKLVFTLQSWCNLTRRPLLSVTINIKIGTLCKGRPSLIFRLIPFSCTTSNICMTVVDTL